MGLISLTEIQDGTTAEAADVNAELTKVFDEFNGGISNANIASNANIDISKLSTGGWTSWTPTYTNFTLGDGTVKAFYSQVGKTISGRIIITLGSTSSVDGTAVTFSTPVTAHSDYATGTHYIGDVRFGDASSTDYVGVLSLSGSTTAITLRAVGASSTYAFESHITPSVPFTWASGDQIGATFVFEAA